jgi:chlorite dismutase
MRTDELKGSRTVGREFAGKVKQLITGSTGPGDAQWGVTLFARDRFQIKAIVYKLRFRPVSAEYADFDELFRRFTTLVLLVLVIVQITHDCDYEQELKPDG